MTVFIWAPAPGAKQTRKPRVRTAKFGDGYQQKVGDGINTLPRSWSLEFPRDSATIDAIDAFLTARGGFEAFQWTPPKGPDGWWTCESWEQTSLVGTDQTLTATFEEWFGA